MLSYKVVLDNSVCVTFVSKLLPQSNFMIMEQKPSRFISGESPALLARHRWTCMAVLSVRLLLNSES